MAATICGSALAAGFPPAGADTCPSNPEAVNKKSVAVAENDFILDMKPRKTSVHLMGLLLDADRKRF